MLSGWINAYPIQMHWNPDCNSTKAPGWQSKWILQPRAMPAHWNGYLLIFTKIMRLILAIAKSRSSSQTTFSCKQDLRIPSIPWNHHSDLLGLYHLAKDSLTDSRSTLTVTRCCSQRPLLLLLVHCQLQEAPFPASTLSSPQPNMDNGQNLDVPLHDPGCTEDILIKSSNTFPKR